ncbi:putative epidermal cell surface receptor isoform X2 [Pieris napi]|uniref:putative epidermal cell surface receptor isoform X2 n=1 Tax=Pieris napi TaxID=78633 RepID=UPI001FBC1226|nr:putative epidermal cell surface receptor isoform X2 [Pieris napi]
MAGAYVVLYAVLLAGVACYTIDCNHEYTDCDTELSKLMSEDDEGQAGTQVTIDVVPPTTTTTTSTVPPTRSTTTEKVKTETTVTTETTAVESMIKPKPRLLNLSVDELQNFANALHNQTNQKEPKNVDLSDVNMDEEDELPKLSDHKQKHISDKFYSNLQAPFNPLMTIDKSEEETCKENEITYKLGEKMDRGCDESCECAPGGLFECSPRCKHPYIRRGRRLNDPLCFESPVDECCSIVACANGEIKPTTTEVCRYGNESYHVGAKWDIGCEQICTCERNSVVTCKPRCNRMPQSDRCINVQDPKDACCEIQVCDVSQDVHEEPIDNGTVTSTTAKPVHDAMETKASRPLVLLEPIGSIKVLQNNSVQVNLIHPNDSMDPIHLELSSDGGQTYTDVELRYKNLILNLEGGRDYILKTKETGTKFNFTITASDDNEVLEERSDNTKEGCYHDGQFYAVGEEIHIGCTELCECTGPDTKECAPLVCPNHVGLELVSKGCVRWAPSPPPQPPNCCPRTARCLSDGTCHYKGVAIPNWSEVPLHLSGCEQHCFCENGELDCQEACNPLPSLPPQTLRCPPMHRPAPVNVSDEDCCKEWGCAPHAGMNASTQKHKTYPKNNYITPSTLTTPRYVLPTPSLTTEAMNFKRLHSANLDFFKHLRPIKTGIPKYLKSLVPVMLNNTYREADEHKNVTAFAMYDVDSAKNFNNQPVVDPTKSGDQTSYVSPTKKFHSEIVVATHDRKKEKTNMWDTNDIKQRIPDHYVNDVNIPTSKETVKYFTPAYAPKDLMIQHQQFSHLDSSQYFRDMFAPLNNESGIVSNPLPKNTIPIDINQIDNIIQNSQGKYVTVLRNKDMPKTNSVEKTVWKPDIRKHLLLKAPSPYETVLLRALPNTRLHSTINEQIKSHKSPSKYSTLDLENILSQMEVETDVNRNLGRSAEKNRATAAGQLPPGFPGSHPAFLPTAPPDDIFSDNQNDIHRPSNPLEPSLAGLPPGLQIPSFGEENRKLTVISLQSDSPTSIKMLFGLPPVLVGLRGSVDLRYTDTDDDDVSHWYSQVFAPADEILTTPRLEFRLAGLKPDTTYKIRGKLLLHNLPVEPESKIYTIRTQSELTDVEEPEEKRRDIDCKLSVVEVNDTTAQVTWRHFTEDELQFIDGVQVRYRPVGTPIYSMTELLHHSRSAAYLQDLRPETRYEASLVLIPPTRAVTELVDSGQVEFTTAPYIDPYNWSVTVEARAVGSEAAEVTWHGVPSPAERWVRVYRAAHACGTSRKEHDDFRLATRDLPPAITLMGLQPNAKCRVWLELFLTNGKVKTSNVLEINTKSLDSPEPVDNEIEASSIAGSRNAPRGDYYGALVIVGVIAALGALSSVLLLLVVIRRHRPHSVPITPPRESSLPPYDNPAYKLELQQETMDL